MQAAPTAGPDGLLEREPDLAALRETLEKAATGEGRLVLIEGEAGIGKTALLEVLADEASRRGARVLQARAAELERDFAHGVCRQLFERPMRAMPPAQRRNILRGAAASAAAMLGVGEADPGYAPDPLAVNHALFWVALAMADESPLVLTIDDAHWADEVSLRWVHYIARRLDGMRVVIALALRPAEPGSPRELLDALRDDAGAVPLRPAALSPPASRTVLERVISRTAAPEFAQACHKVSGGNPFLLTELARAVVDEGIEPSAETVPVVREFGSRSIARRVLGRLGTLAPDAMALAHATAVLDADADLPHVAAVAGLTTEAAHTAALSLVEAQILVSGPVLRFAHPIVRQAVYEDVGDQRLPILHRRAAQVLVEGGDNVDRAAVHLLRSAPDADPYVVHHLRAAAMGAVARGAAGSAVALLRRALNEPPPHDERAAVLLELGRALQTMGDPEAVTRLEEALGDAPRGLRPAIVRELAASLVFFGDVNHAADILLEVAAELPDDERERRIELEAVHLAICAIAEPLAPRAVERLPNLLAKAPGDTAAERLLLAAASHHRVFNNIPTAEKTAELAMRALAHRWESGEPVTSTIYWLGAGVGLVFADRSEEVEALIDEAEADAAQRGSPSAYLCAQTLRSRYALMRGALTEAEETGRAVVDASDVLGPIMREWVLGFIVYSLVEQGRTQDADHLLEQWDLLRGELAPTSSAHWLLLARAALHRTAGRLDLAMADVEDSLKRQSRRGGVFVRPLASGSRALTLHAAGEHARAAEEAGADLEANGRCGPPGAAGWAHLALARVKGGPGALDHLNVAVKLLRESPRRLDYAHALVELGAALRRNRHRAEAREPLRLGLDLAQHCGASPLVEKAVTELAASGARPRRLVLTGLDALTPSERRVADLAAAGHTNREIAQSLFVTRKTVESHLRQTYMKLGIRSREELPEAMQAREPKAPQS